MTDHALITWLSCTAHVADHAMITWLSCTAHVADHAMITQLSKIIPVEKLTNFYLTMGNNTGYVNTIEDCAADNFAMAVCYQNEISYSTPDIINAILDYLKTGNETKPVTGKGPEVTIILE